MTQKQSDIEDMKEKAEAGDLFAQRYLGRYYSSAHNEERDYMAALNWFEMAARVGDLDSLFRCAQIMETELITDLNAVRKALKYYNLSAEQGWPASQLRLAEIYENGLGAYQLSRYKKGYEAVKVVEVDYYMAVLWYEKAARGNNHEANYRLGLLQKEGLGTTKNVKKAYNNILKAACNFVVEAFAELSRLYFKGIGTKKNIMESYIWALISKAQDHTSIDSEYEQMLERKLSDDQIVEAQDEAEMRVNMLNHEEITPEYCLKAAELTYRGKIAQQEVSPPKAIMPSEPVPENNTIAEPDDPEPSPGVAYKYVNQIKKNFDPALVEFELVVPRKLKKSQDMDFTHIKITYNNRDSDKKSIEEFTRHKVNRAQRRLLICLAAQKLISDEEQRAVAVKRILCEVASKDSVSRLNGLFKLIFPGCAKSKADKMLNRQAGLVNIRLSIDTTKINSARDYDFCGL